jgi:4-hydroxybenzoate polyprenyltransferase
VASHLGVFSGVLASEGVVNLTGSHKLNRLRDTLSDSFSYIGNASADLPLLLKAKEPMVANPSMRLRAKLRANRIQPALEFDERASPITSVIKALRVHQWAKNILICFPLLLSHRFSASDLFKTVLAFLCFSFAASGTYVINDLFDIEADRQHYRKKLRPFAAGDLSVVTGAVIVFVFLALALGGASFLPAAAFGWILVYLATTLAYSFYLKRVPLVDVLVLSGLYTLRLLVGGGATGTPISHWLAGFSVFVFFSLALAKRFAELENLRSSASQPRNGRGYQLGDLEQLRSFGTASAYAAIVIFAIYISGHDVMALYRRPNRLWLAVPLMLLWLSRTWLLASRGELNEDPVVFAFTDRLSLLIGIAIAVIALLAL